MKLRSIELRKLVVAFVLATLSSSRVSIGLEPRSSTPEAERHQDSKTESRVKVHLSWGHTSAPGTDFFIKLLVADASVEDLASEGLEEGEAIEAGILQTRAGGGDVDGANFILRYPNKSVTAITNLHSIWSHLLASADADTARRLRLDPGIRPDVRKLTILMDRQGTRGFSVTVDQLLTNKVFWLSDLDVFISTGQSPVSFANHRKEIANRASERILDRVAQDPEASYEQFTTRWEDMGNPNYHNPAARPPGHIVCLTWDSAVRKFGIDRGSGVHSDLGNPDKFHFWLDIGELTKELAASWKGQKLTDGLPVITTGIEKKGVRYEIEQFAYPLDGPPPQRVGEMPMGLLQRVRVSELSGTATSVSIRLNRQLEPAGRDGDLTVRTEGNALICAETGAQEIAFTLEGTNLALRSVVVVGQEQKTQVLEVAVNLPAHGSRDLVIKLPSPLVPESNRERLLSLDFASARTATLRYWSDYLAQGAQFKVPEAAVNELFRANLWHALRLPRRHGSHAASTRIDLPYSNFAYDQKGTPWPVNQAVYVDYMLYDLRGYHGISAEELAAIYRENQEPSGRVRGYANWGVYTPSMIYAVAQHYLLTGDRSALNTLLPQTLSAMDWCLAQAKKAERNTGPARGLLLAPLNDLTKDARAWAFNQAYLFAGMDLFSRVLTEIRHPRAEECGVAARAIREAVELGFKRSTAQAPVVQLRDHSWIPYVPCDALTPRRLMEIWYPTDVDTGALHLSRFKAIDPSGALTTYLLNDHEDNLFYRGWGMANEPVYTQQATAYLLRDEVKPAIRAFYSMMACAFSHSVFEPVEHRWAWGQYFGPPSTDGAWFELFRRMLVHELDDDTLLLLQATPRRWLEDGKRIEVERAPTYYGPLKMIIDSHAASGQIRANIELSARKRPGLLLVRLRHPQGKPIKAVTLNGRNWTDFDPNKEWVRIVKPNREKYEIISRF
jgi:hypothetical protein